MPVPPYSGASLVHKRLPFMTGGRCQERLGAGAKRLLRAEIHQEKSRVFRLFREIAQDKGTPAEDRAIHAFRD